MASEHSVCYLLVKFLTLCCWAIFLFACISKLDLYMRNPKKFEFAKEKITLDDFPTVVICPAVPYRAKLMGFYLEENVFSLGNVSGTFGSLVDKIKTRERVVDTIKKLQYTGRDLVNGAYIETKDDHKLVEANLSHVGTSYMFFNTCPTYSIRKMIRDKLPKTLYMCLNAEADDGENILEKKIYLLSENQIGYNVLDGKDDYMHIKRSETLTTLVEISKFETIANSGSIWSETTTCEADPAYDFDNVLLSNIHKFSNASIGCTIPLMGGYETQYDFCNSSNIARYFLSPYLKDTYILHIGRHLRYFLE